MGFGLDGGVAQGVKVSTKPMGVEDEFDGVAFLIGDLAHDPGLDTHFMKRVHHFAKVALEDFGGMSVGAFAVGDCDIVGVWIGDAISGPAGNKDDLFDVVFFDEAKDGIVEARNIGSGRVAIGIEDGRMGGLHAIVEIDFTVVAKIAKDREQHMGVAISPKKNGKGTLVIGCFCKEGELSGLPNFPGVVEDHFFGSDGGNGLGFYAKAARDAFHFVDHGSGECDGDGGAVEEFESLLASFEEGFGSERTFHKTPRKVTHQEGRSDENPSGFERCFVNGEVFAKDEERPMPEVERVGDFADKNEGREAKEFARCGEGITIGEDEKSGTKNRRKGCEAGERGARRILAEGEDDHAETDPAENVWNDSSRGETNGNDGDDGAEEEFPGPGGEKVEGGCGMVEDTVDAPGEGKDEEDEDPDDDFCGSSLGEENEEERKEEVELFLDRQRPSVEKEFKIGGGGKVARLLPKVEVRDHQGLGGRGFSKVFVLIWEENEGGRKEDAERQEGGGRKDAANAAFPKSLHAEVTANDVFGDDGGNEVAGDHEKDVHAHKSPGEAKASMEKDHGDDSEGTESVDVRTVAKVFQTGGVESHDWLRADDVEKIGAFFAELAIVGEEPVAGYFPDGVKFIGASDEIDLQRRSRHDPGRMALRKELGNGKFRRRGGNHLASASFSL